MAAPLAHMTPPPAAFSFLEANQWEGATLVPLAGDASFRRYFRAVGDGRSAVLMDAPPPHEDPRPFIAVAEYLMTQGFAAPRILASDVDRGLILLEDFGDGRMAEALIAAPEIERDVYARAIDLLVALRRCPPPPLRPYDMTEYQRETGLFAEWYIPAVGLSVDVDAYTAAWTEVLAPVARHQTVTVLRDYHAENIMMLSGKSGVAGLGLLDFQDALAGHPAYDLVSLLQDARRDVPSQLEAEMLDRYAGQADLDPSAYAILGAQRNAKILGIFTRLWKRDGKARYLNYQPRVWSYLERDLKHPALAPVADWFRANVPEEYRASFVYEVAP